LLNVEACPLYLRASDADSHRVDDNEAPRQGGKICLLNELGDKPIHSQWAHALRAKKNYSRMTSGRKLMEVCKFKVERKKHPTFGFRNSPDLNIGLAQQTFVFSAYAFMAFLDDNDFQMAGDILIELDLHEAVIFQTFS
jgi:hypothetical protein